jgi:hypothetical protein
VHWMICLDLFGGSISIILFWRLLTCRLPYYFLLVLSLRRIDSVVLLFEDVLHRMVEVLHNYFIRPFIFELI